MATIDSEWERLGFLRGKGRGHEKCHVVLIEEEAKARVENAGPKPKTRFVMECDDPEFYSKFNELKDRWFGVGNKSVCLSLMADRWDLSEAEIRNLCEGVE